MPLSPTQAAELATLIPAHLTCTDARTRLLCIAELLRTLTDESHPLSNADIRTILGIRFGEQYAPAENTVASDLRALRTADYLGLRVHVTPSGAWAQNTRLSPADVRLLLNAVQASRLLPTDQSVQLQEALLDQVSYYQQDDLLGEVHVDQRVPRSYQQVFDACDVISRALRTGHKVSFIYTYVGFQGKATPLPGDDGSLVRTETPIALIFSDNNYYLESYAKVPWRHGLHLMRSRVDRMTEVRVSSEPADENDEATAAKASIARRVAEGYEMIEGPSRVVFLRVKAAMTNTMYDMFGYGLRYSQVIGPMGDAETTALTCVRIAQTFTFFRWLTAAGDGIVLAEPPAELTLHTGPWRHMLADITREQLLDDYHAMVEGYLAFLDRARMAYS